MVVIRPIAEIKRENCIGLKPERYASGFSINL